MPTAVAWEGPCFGFVFAWPVCQASLLPHLLVHTEIEKPMQPLRASTEDIGAPHLESQRKVAYAERFQSFAAASSTHRVAVDVTIKKG